MHYRGTVRSGILRWHPGLMNGYLMQSLFLFVPVVKAHPGALVRIRSSVLSTMYKQLAIKCGFIYKKMKPAIPFQKN